MTAQVERGRKVKIITGTLAGQTGLVAHCYEGNYGPCAMIYLDGYWDDGTRYLYDKEFSVELVTSLEVIK